VNVNKGRNFLAELFVLYKAGFVLQPILVEFDLYAVICVFIKKNEIIPVLSLQRNEI
jgi:hypothetical protein